MHMIGCLARPGNGDVVESTGDVVESIVRSWQGVPVPSVCFLLEGESDDLLRRNET